MIRFRWYRLFFGSVSLRSLSASLSQGDFSQDSAYGFRVTHANRNQISARYIERRHIVEVVEDPFGVAHSYERDAYEVISFTIRDSIPELTVTGSLRRIGGFLTRLGAMTDFQVSVEPVKVSLRDWLTHYEKGREGLEVRELRLRQVPLASGATATICAQSFSDVRQAIDGAPLLRGSVWDRIVVRDRQHKLLMSMNGSALAPAELRPLLESALAAAVRQNSEGP